MKHQPEYVYREALLEMIAMVRRTAEYLNDPDLVGMLPPLEYEGMKQAYFRVMDGIVSQIKTNPELSLSEFGLDGYKPSSILQYDQPSQRVS